MSYQRKSSIQYPTLDDFTERYLKRQDIIGVLVELGYDEQIAVSISVELKNNPEFRSVIDRIDAQTTASKSDPSRMDLSVAAMVNADIRAAYANGCALSPDQLPWDVQAIVKSAKYDRHTEQWSYTFIDRTAVIDKYARLVGAYEQPDDVVPVNITIAGSDVDL